MKKRLMITTLVIVLVCSVGFAFASVNWYESGEEIDASSYDDSSTVRYIYSSAGVGYDIFGVCSSADTLDWYRFKTSANGIFNIELDLNDTNLDADIYLMSPDGTQMNPGYPSGNSKLISNLYIPQNEWWGVKIVYKSGVPKTPYRLKMRLDPSTYAAYSQVRNIEYVPQELLEK